MDVSFFTIAAVIAIGFQLFLIFLALFEPSLPYKVSERPQEPLDSEEFVRLLGIMADAQVHHSTRVEVLTNGEVFYEAQIQAIRAARDNVNLEAYIFRKGEVARRFLEALTERARAGVAVKVVLDAVGSFRAWRRLFHELLEAGGRVEFCHPFRWDNLPRVNNRTHRELLVVDGLIGFIGGAGIADHWQFHRPKHPRWRDTVFRVEGEVVTSLQSTFIENWLESSGELLSGAHYYPPCEAQGPSTSMVINSSPSAGRATRARILYQTLIASARETIYVTTPYFLPDRSARAELVRAIHDRGVDVEIIVPGHRSDQTLTRGWSRRLYGDLLQAGARIFEYQPSMIHTKTMTIDGVWSVVGSTNFDHRSFGLNDEVNLAVNDRHLALRIQEDFVRDRAQCLPITYKEWRRRSVWERLQECFGWLLERQQ
jgi:cardiolipin synthase